jgi:serine/threonine-protein kinase
MGADAALGLIGQVLQETYRIERKIGEGGMGAVYEASHTRVRRRFAIKVLSPEVASNEEAFARFRREAEITSELGHPHIIEVIDFNVTASGSPYMVMELLQGESLGDHIQREGALPLARVEAILRQTAAALAAAHRRGVIHRDLKPQNIFLCQREDGSEVVKVLDFGISKVKGSRSMMTGTHVVIGTPNYMTPEQAEGRAAQVTEQTDVFALGTILYEMLSGQAPFLADTIPAVLYQVVHVEPPSLAGLRSDLPQGARLAVERALRKRPEERWASIEELAQAFAAALAGAGVDLLGSTALPRSDLTGPVLRSAPAVVTGPGPDAARSTLSASAGELSLAPAVEPSPPRNRIAIYALAAFLVAGGLAGGIVYLALGREERSDPAGRGGGSAVSAGSGVAAARPDQRVAIRPAPDARSAAPDRALLAARPDLRPPAKKRRDPIIKKAQPAAKVQPAAAKPTFGTLNVVSPPAAATIDGRPVTDGAPFGNLRLGVGRHTLKLNKKGCAPYSTTVVIERDKLTVIKAQLTCN